MTIRGIIRRLFGKRSQESTGQFAGHYDEWREKRIQKIIAHYGRDFFKGKRVLEVGCGYADIGAAFSRLGAQVTVSDGRAEHLDVVAKRHPQLQRMQADLDGKWPFDERFDVLIFFGVLYHLKDPVHALKEACRIADHIVLETEVCDSTDPNAVLFTKEDGYDQALNRTGCRPSTAFVERILKNEGRTWTRVADASCNSGFHVYDWV